MVRKYKRKLESRNYINYSEAKLNEAVTLIKAKKCTFREATKRFKIPMGTLYNKCKQKHPQNVGHPTALSAAEELCIVKNTQIIASWGFPLDNVDIRKLVHCYLLKVGKTVLEFKNNYPSKEWIFGFLKRHKNEIVLRTCQNIKKNRAAVSAKVIEDYFKHLKSCTEGIPPENIFNFDETNLSDNPGSKKCIFKRGTKYPERVRDFSKSAISIMFCGSANGSMLPAYVVYKAEHLWTTWCEGGPRGTRYGRTKSGWFDSFAFQDWFETIIVPAAKKLPGKKVIIGDNLSSHFNHRVLQLCQENDILFCCLPPNSTHLCQPLDVCFYGPLKRYWRSILDTWKLGLKKKSQLLSKEEFPRLLKNLYEKLYPGNKEESNNMISGFEKCGIFPSNPVKVLERLPDYEQGTPDVGEVEAHVSNAIIEILKDLRGVNEIVRRKKKKINVPAGQSISIEDLGDEEAEKENISPPPLESDSEESYEQESDEIEENETNENEEIIPKCGQYYVVKFQVKNLVRYYIGQIISTDELSANRLVEMKFLRASRTVNNKFLWPQVPDEGEIPASELVKELSEPTIDRRQALLFKLSEIKSYLKYLQ